MKKIIYSALALLTLASCSKTDETTTITTDGEVRITSSIATRTSGNTWDSGDEIGVYMSTNGADPYVVGDLGENVLYTTTYGDGTFTTSTTTTLYYPASGNVNLLAYYPYVATTADYTFDAEAYPVNVAVQTTQGDIDLMVATVTNQAKTISPVGLVFDHKLSNIVLNVTNGDGYANLSAIGKISKIELSGGVTTADFNLTNDDISLGSDTETIEFVVSQTTTAITAEAIIIPQTLSNSNATLSVTTEAGAVHTVALNGTYDIGSQYSYDLKLSLTALTISGAKIEDWNKVSGGELEATVPEPIWDGSYPASVAEAIATLGSADENGAYQIGGVDKFAAFAYLVNNDYDSFSDADVILNCNIDLCGEEWTPIGTDYYIRYSGKFDGGGYEVRNLYIDNSTSSYQGLFGFTEANAEISNLGVSGSVSGSSSVGGVVGVNDGGTLINCYYTGSVSGVMDVVGGVVGYNNRGTLTNCHNTGDVSGGDNYIGGVVGFNGGTITNCYNTGSVSGDMYVGGVAGNNSEPLTNCYNTGDVSGSGIVGGVVGWNYYSTLTNCYNTGSVSSEGESVGGVAGQNDGTLTNCYNTGSVSSEGESVGGVVGWNTDTITNCYYDFDVAGVIGAVGDEADDTTDYKYCGLSTDNMKGAAEDEGTLLYYLTNEGYGNSDAWVADTGPYINNGYPILTWQVATE
ncbi:MAG: fimbrillin family protein [Rikenellaceae bacterium]